MKHSCDLYTMGDIHINLILAALKIPIDRKWKIISEYILYVKTCEIVRHYLSKDEEMSTPNCWKDVSYAGKPQTFNSTSGLSGSKRASTSLRFTSSKLDGFHLGFCRNQTH